jgi:O-antigen ligase
MIDSVPSKWSLRETLSHPENVIVLLITCGFLVNVQQGYDTNAVLRSDPLVFKGIRILTILAAEWYALSTVVKRGIPHTLCLIGPMLPLALYCCCCLLSVPFSSYPLLSLFKTSEIALVILLCLIGMTSSAGAPADFFRLNVKIVLFYNLLIWGESVLFPRAAWYPLKGETPFFRHALSGVFPVINGNMVGLLGAVLFLAYLPRLCGSAPFSVRLALPVLIGLASTVFSYSRSSLLALVVAALCVLLMLRRYGWILVILLCGVLLATVPKVRTLTIAHLARGQEGRSFNTLSSNRLEMWEDALSEYRTSVVGRGFAAGFRYDDHQSDGHAHNSVVQLYFDLGLLGVIVWLAFIGTVCSYLYRLVKTQVTPDGQLVSVAGVMVFLLMKALASTVFVHLDQGMLLLVAIIVYVMRRLAVSEYAEPILNSDADFSFSRGHGV